MKNKDFVQNLLMFSLIFLVLLLTTSLILDFNQKFNLLNNIILLITAIIILFYTFETSKLRKIEQERLIKERKPKIKIDLTKIGLLKINLNILNENNEILNIFIKCDYNITINNKSLNDKIRKKLFKTIIPYSNLRSDKVKILQRNDEVDIEIDIIKLFKKESMNVFNKIIENDFAWTGGTVITNDYYEHLKQYFKLHCEINDAISSLKYYFKISIVCFTSSSNITPYLSQNYCYNLLNNEFNRILDKGEPIVDTLPIQDWAKKLLDNYNIKYK